MTTLQDFWLGYSNSLVTSSTFLVRTIVDFVLVAIILTFVIYFLNNKKGWHYILTVVVVLAGLIISDFLLLTGLHVVTQFLLIVLAITLPVIYSEELESLFDKNSRNATNDRPSVFLTILVAIIMAFGVVVAGNGATNETNTLPDKITVTATNLATGLTADTSGQSVEVTVLANRSVWGGLSANSFSASVDTANQQAGTYQLPVSVVSTVDKTKVLHVSPSSISVTIEPIVKKTVPVSVKFSGKAGNGLVPDVPVLTPNSVVISGAKSVLDGITQVTAPVALNGETTPIDEKVAAQVQDVSGNIIPGVTIDPAQIEVKDNIVKPGITKTVGIQPVISGTPSSGYWVSAVTTNPSVVTITGAPDALDAVNIISTSPVSVNGVTQTGNQSATLVIPTGITLTDTSISKITVTTTLSSTSTNKSITPSINYQNVNAALKVTTTTPTSLSAIVSGSSNALGLLVDSNVVVNLDLSSYLSPGTYSVNITNSSFTAPSGIGIVSYLPSAINVTLENK